MGEMRCQKAMKCFEVQIEIGHFTPINHFYYKISILHFVILTSLCVRQVASSKWLIFDLINTRVIARFTIAPRYQTTPVIRCVLVNYRLIRYYWGGGGLGCVIWIQMVDINNQRIGATKTRWRRQTIFFLLRVLSETQKDSCFIWI